MRRFDQYGDVQVPDLPAATEPATSVALAAAARLIGAEARRLGVGTPSFRCPPRLVGVDRTLRRRGTTPSDVVVSVRLKGRAWIAVLADMIEGVIAANRLVSPDADRVRRGLWEASGYASGVERVASQQAA